ncbi:MAG: hypothetical protein B7X34_03175 [Acidobacteriia bacterium 12-62-4]|nr:MAG: hypothetical protein B7X34_03175 [Acidobacteriia bacterium 12-62-4]
MFKEFLTPPESVAAAGFLLARCAGEDKYFGVIDALFHSQNELFTTGDAPTVVKSSRYRLISRAPVGTSRPSKSLIFAANRFASGTPRRLIPIKASLSRSVVFSSTS